jgi:hypothetical protein
VAQFSGSVLVGYEVPITAALSATANLGDLYSGDRYSQFNLASSSIRLPAYGAIDASAGLRTFPIAAVGCDARGGFCR